MSSAATRPPRRWQPSRQQRRRRRQSRSRPPRAGEASLNGAEMQMIAKAIPPLPAAKDEEVDGEVVRHATLSDPETRYRQRYADLAVNPHVREVFRVRAAIVRALREFLDRHDFLEVETPVLQPVYGGAAAPPMTPQPK